MAALARRMTNGTSPASHLDVGPRYKWTALFISTLGMLVVTFFECRIEGKPTPVTVKLSYEQAAALADLLEPFRKE